LYDIGLSLSNEIIPALHEFNILNDKLHDLSRKIFSLLKRLTEDTTIEIMTSFDDKTHNASFKLFAAESEHHHSSKHKKHTHEHVGKFFFLT
jgi:predicted ATP-grasp superfamily ATP-dependent carboligase